MDGRWKRKALESHLYIVWCAFQVRTKSPSRLCWWPPSFLPRLEQTSTIGLVRSTCFFSFRLQPLLLRLESVHVILLLFNFILLVKIPRAKHEKLKSKVGMARGPVLNWRKQSSRALSHTSYIVSFVEVICFRWSLQCDVICRSVWRKSYTKTRKMTVRRGSRTLHILCHCCIGQFSTVGRGEVLGMGPEDPTP